MKVISVVLRYLGHTLMIFLEIYRTVRRRNSAIIVYNETHLECFSKSIPKLMSEG